jgi:transposase
MPPQYVRPFVKAQKNDYLDAEAIAEAVQRPTMHFVPLKTVDQLDLQALHRVRDRLVAFADRRHEGRRTECAESGNLDEPLTRGIVPRDHRHLLAPGDWILWRSRGIQHFSDARTVRPRKVSDELPSQLRDERSVGRINTSGSNGYEFGTRNNASCAKAARIIVATYVDINAGHGFNRY